MYSYYFMQACNILRLVQTFHNLFSQQNNISVSDELSGGLDVICLPEDILSGTFPQKHCNLNKTYLASCLHPIGRLCQSLQ